MAFTLSDIQTNIAFEIDGNATISASSSDWGSRLAPINRSLFDWAETYDWSQLIKINNGLISSPGNVTYSLPSDYRRVMGYPKIVWDGRTTESFPIVEVYKNYELNDSADRWVNFIGNDKDGNSMIIHAPSLISGASVQVTYYAFPLSLSSTGQTTECPDPTYLVQRSLYYIYKAREDGRFPEAKAESERILARMIENENTKGVGYTDRNVQISSLPNFRVGRD